MYKKEQHILLFINIGSINTSIFKVSQNSIEQWDSEKRKTNDRKII